MKSKTQINKWMQNKTNSELVDTIFLAKKTGNIEIASEVSMPARQLAAVNITQIAEAKEDTIIVPGKVLSNGEIEKKKTIYALGYSEKAREKLKKAGCETYKILDGLKKLKGSDKMKGEIVK
jgi:large subunit ribosomal protein L18e